MANAYVMCPTEDPPAPDISTLLRPMGRAVYYVLGGVWGIVMAVLRPALDALLAFIRQSPSQGDAAVLPR